MKNILIGSGYDPGELDELEKLYSRIDRVDVPETSEKLDINFYRSLRIYKDAHKENSTGLKVLIGNMGKVFKNKYVSGFAYSLLLIAAGWYMGSLSNQEDIKLRTMSKEIDQMKQVMIYTMLEQPSATKRIKAISYADEFETVDDKILNAFLDTLNSDPNPNVRLTAVEALSKYSDVQFVRKDTKY